MDGESSTADVARDGHASRCEPGGITTGLKSGQVRALLRNGKRYRGRAVTVVYRSRQAPGTGLSVVAATRWGNAVARNRFRRVVREFLRQNAGPALPGMEMVIQCRKRIDRECELEALQDLKAFLETGAKARKN